MPIIFNGYRDESEYYRFKSVLIVPCRFCPAASSAVRNNKPYLEILRRFMKTESYENEIKTLRSNLEKQRIRTEIFESKLMHQFVLCMWTAKRRNKLLEKARDFEAVIVLGCDAATQTVRDSIEPSGCEVIQGLDSLGIMSIQPRLSFPANISLDLESITPFTSQEVLSGESMAQFAIKG